MISHTFQLNVLKNTPPLSLVVWLTLIDLCNALNHDQLQDGLYNQEDHQQVSKVQRNLKLDLGSDLQEDKAGDLLLRDTCPKGYTFLAHQCLSISQKKLSWMEAEEDCAHQRGHLVIVRDTEAMKILITNTNTQENFWLGANKYEDQ
ncbi:unnamed protein product, partial [Meganyctiphanes norvegica]